MERGNSRLSLSRGIFLPMISLQPVSEYCRLDRKPPVTTGLIAANTLIYLTPTFLDPILPTRGEVCFSPHLIFKYKDLKRFFLSPFYHIGVLHLIYNMLSLLWYGIRMETSMGSVEFASMVATLLGMSQGITLLLAKFLLHFFDYESAYYNQCAVGFSGVVFAMKVVLNSQSDNYTYVYGLTVHNRYAAWAELFLIQMFMPNVYFLGHLGGILAGLLYLRLKASYSGPNPLTRIIRHLTSVLTWPLSFVKPLFGYQQRQIYGRGTVGGNHTRSVSGVWRCRACTFDNSDWLNICEMCGTGRDGGLSSLEPSEETHEIPSSDQTHEIPSSDQTHEIPSSDQTHEIPLEELRRRRVERFGRRFGSMGRWL